MLEIYETVQPVPSNHVITSTIVLIISIAVAGFMTFEAVSSKHKKIIGFIWAISIASALLALIVIIGNSAVDSGDVSKGPLNKEQYQLKVINSQIIKIDDDKHIMKIDDKEFDAFKILAVTDNAYVVEGTSKDNSLHKVFELKKSDYNFKEE